MKLVRSFLSIVCGLPCVTVRSAPAIVFSGPAPAFTHVMACTLAESPSDPFHRKLRQLRCLRCRFDCFYEKVIKVKADVAVPLMFDLRFGCVWDCSALVGSQTPPLAFPISIFFISVTEHPGSASNQVPRETLVDATHRCRASIRTLNGPFWTRCKLGFDPKPRVHHHRDEPGIVGCCHLPGGLK